MLSGSTIFSKNVEMKMETNYVILKFGNTLKIFSQIFNTVIKVNDSLRYSLKDHYGKFNKAFR
jgi:hypothetical protein